MRRKKTTTLMQSINAMMLSMIVGLSLAIIDHWLSLHLELLVSDICMSPMFLEMTNFPIILFMFWQENLENK